ncbi:Protein yippee-like 5 [Homalodisca vitripennis]|nr:Protein yippee-like 5 [Homalodisca vitripennis]
MGLRRLFQVCYQEFSKLCSVSQPDHGEVQDRVMLTGRHMVRDVSCKNCDAKLGWIYEFATEENQRYKEGRVILERALVTESDGIDEHMGDG